MANETDVTVVAGENAYRVEGARRLVENQGVDVIHPDVPKTSGMYETKKAADMAKAYHIPLALHNVASPVGTVASVHVGAAASNFLALEYHARATSTGGVTWSKRTCSNPVGSPSRTTRVSASNSTSTRSKPT
ncbi:Galactonate dehydratase [Candidatus Halobonum tyrrellensis G22]|uniref:Galactonate dehydratase n=1 Tax=Candidatus Halobonum tyrrellensis G22 TaxID=1324957 RepID=V4H8Q9_9EURY|nr:Galactonate dehydratase [Candidatus Halobonum tyrrellensis G22]